MFKFKTVLDLIVKFAWPWLRDIVLPHILVALKELIDEGMARVKKFIRDKINGKSKKDQDYAHAKAEAADANAKAASSDAEREKQEAIAKVWREVAEHLRKENEAMRAEFEEFAAREEQKMHDELNAMKPDVDVSSGKPVLVIGTTRTTLPALPAVTE